MINRTDTQCEEILFRGRKKKPQTQIWFARINGSVLIIPGKIYSNLCRWDIAYKLRFSRLRNRLIGEIAN